MQSVNKITPRLTWLLLFNSLSHCAFPSVLEENEPLHKYAL